MTSLDARSDHWTHWWTDGTWVVMGPFDRFGGYEGCREGSSSRRVLAWLGCIHTE